MMKGRATYVLAWVLLGVVGFVGAPGCTGSDSGGTVLSPPDIIEVLLPEAPGPPPPECDENADPTGCAEGAFCWFGKCALTEASSLTTGAEEIVGAVAAVADGKGSTVVAYHVRRPLTGGAEGGAVREDELLAAFRDADGAFGAATLVDRWTETEADATGPAIRAVRSDSGTVTLVRGPVALQAYTWRAGGWAASAVQDTGARLHSAEGALAAAMDDQDVLHVAYHDVTREKLMIASLGSDGTWQLEEVEELREVWGVLVAATTLQGKVVFVYTKTGEPADSRGVLLFTQTDGGWHRTNPSTVGPAIRGVALGLEADVDAQNRLTLGWLTHKGLGHAIRETDGTWTSPDFEHVLEAAISEDLYRNLTVGWWQDALVLTWIGYPKWECHCFDLRMAMIRGGEWLDHRVVRYEGFAEGKVAAALDGQTGLLTAAVGGGPFVERGIPAPLLYTTQLPDWTEVP